MENKKEKYNIRIFSMPECPQCRTLKLYLDAQGIEYDDIDVSGNKKAGDEMIQKSGQTGVPVIEINGEMIVGFDTRKINQILKT